MTHFLGTLEPTEYGFEISKLKKKIDNNDYCTPAGRALSSRPLYTRLRSLFLTSEVLKAKMEIAKKDMSTRTVSQDLPSQGAEGRTSIGTPGTQSSRETRHNLQTGTPPPAPGRNNLASSSRKKKKETPVQQSVRGEASFASTVINIPEVHDPQRVYDYK